MYESSANDLRHVVSCIAFVLVKSKMGFCPWFEGKTLCPTQITVCYGHSFIEKTKLQLVGGNIFSSIHLKTMQGGFDRSPLHNCHGHFYPVWARMCVSNMGYTWNQSAWKIFEQDQRCTSILQNFDDLLYLKQVISLRVIFIVAFSLLVILLEWSLSMNQLNFKIL